MFTLGMRNSGLTDHDLVRRCDAWTVRNKRIFAVGRQPVGHGAGGLCAQLLQNPSNALMLTLGVDRYFLPSFYS